MSISIGYVEIRNIDETDILEVDNGAGGKLYLTWSVAPIPATGATEIHCPQGHSWERDDREDAYLSAVHARAVTLARAVTGDFDEEAERSRLQMVPA